MSEPWGPGFVIADKYRLEKQLGRGGMGSVWLGQHLALSSTVAIKLIDPVIGQDTGALQRFLREAQSAASLRSPHVVQIMDYGVHEKIPFIVMELLDGESLASRLERVGRLSLAETATLLSHVGRAMSRAHEAGIVHRDLKPDNIYIVRNDDEELAKVLDFGIAKTSSSSLTASSQTRTGALLGTPYYMSPEQAEGNKSIDFRSDLWSMGVIAFECVVGSRPFDGDALGSLVLQICTRPIVVPSTVASVPEGFDAWFARAVERDPKARFQSARELATALRSLAGTERPSSVTPAAEPQLAPITASAPARTHNTAAGLASTRNPRAAGSQGPLLIGATLAGLLVAGGIGVALFGGGGTEASAEPPVQASPAAPSGVEPLPSPPRAAPPVEPSARAVIVVEPEPVASAPVVATPSPAAAETRTPTAPKPKKTPGATAKTVATATPAKASSPAAPPAPTVPKAAAPAPTAKRAVDLGI